MNTLLQDLRYGFRMLLKQKGLTAVALLSLALGIGANTALFSIVDAMLLKMLPVKEPERLVLFKSVAPREFTVGSYNGSSNTDPETGLRTMTSFAYQSYQRMREQQGPMSDIIRVWRRGTKPQCRWPGGRRQRAGRVRKLLFGARRTACRWSFAD